MVIAATEVQTKSFGPKTCQSSFAVNSILIVPSWHNQLVCDLVFLSLLFKHEISGTWI